jgi:hypothetical protein
MALKNKAKMEKLGVENVEVIARQESNRIDITS